MSYGSTDYLLCNQPRRSEEREKGKGDEWGLHMAFGEVMPKLNGLKIKKEKNKRKSM